VISLSWRAVRFSFNRAASLWTRAWILVAKAVREFESPRKPFGNLEGYVRVRRAEFGACGGGRLAAEDSAWGGNPKERI
jgi:hypothetical protein